jgi:hypothetical protein
MGTATLSPRRSPTELQTMRVSRSRCSTDVYEALAASGAHQQARAENGMYRYKRIIGDHLRAIHRESQKKEALIAVNVINRMTALGVPKSEKIVA